MSITFDDLSQQHFDQFESKLAKLEQMVNWLDDLRPTSNRTARETERVIHLLSEAESLLNRIENMVNNSGLRDVWLAVEKLQTLDISRDDLSTVLTNYQYNLDSAAK